ncbi:hypothetical protein EZV62_027848 [Acer yangbiense]|uniref:Uncharacterized protein n=1 Tax=Acer yangbiense TaxID=1000413 RepID=A0A5C7GPB9_9ROSI|nr:hypothetical protein EZV62_027848 [Acer yangbiense]
MAKTASSTTYIFNAIVFVVLVINSNFGESQSIVKTLPGYAGKLPFTMETGYVGVGDLDELQLFYYFVESVRNPVRDPLLLWLTGGPGCSGFSGLVFEVGPLTFDYETFNGSLPLLLDNPYSYTNIANMIFLDAPVGTGFSYSKTQKGWYSSDTLSTKAIYEFIQKWIMDHPKFSNNPLYITGDSYSGMIVPMVSLEIAIGNMAKHQPYLHFQSAKQNCGQEYITPDILNADCMNDIELIARTKGYLKEKNSNMCSPTFGQTMNLFRSSSHQKYLFPLIVLCEGTVLEWKRCNKTLAYDSDVLSVVFDHKQLINGGYRGLVYSGDHDMLIPYTGTTYWIKTLNLTVIDVWRPWFVEGQIAGFTVKYANITSTGDGLVFATVKGGGHTAPEYKPKECLAMVDRWLSYYLL